MKDCVVAVAIAGVLLSGCATTQPEGVDAAANEPDLPTPPEEESVDSGLRKSEGKDEEIDFELRESGRASTPSEIPDLEEAGVPSTVSHEGETVAESSKPKVPSDSATGFPSEQSEKISSKDSAEANGEPVSKEPSSVASLAEGNPPPRPDLGEATSEPRSSTFPSTAGTPAVPATPSPDEASSIANGALSDLPGKHLPAPVSLVAPHSIESKVEHSSQALPVGSSNPDEADSLEISVAEEPPLSPANEAASRTTFSPVAGPVAAPGPRTGGKVSPADRGLSSTEPAEGPSAANGPRNAPLPSSPADEEQDRPSRVGFPARPEATDPTKEDTGRRRRIGSRDTPLIAFLGRKTSRSSVGFSEDFAPEGQPADDGKRTGIGFSRRPSLSSWLRSDPVRRVGFSGKPESGVRETEQIEEPSVSSGGGVWEYRAAASWLRRRDAEREELASGDARSYEEVETWLRRNVPEGSELPEFTVRDYARMEAWLRAKGETHSVDDSINASSRKYAALAKWLTRKPSSSTFEAPASGSSPHREYSKVLKWLRGNRVP